MTGERETMQLIRQAICSGRLKQPMRGADLNKALGITWGGNFLAKHCLGIGSFHCPLRARFPRSLPPERLELSPKVFPARLSCRRLL